MTSDEKLTRIQNQIERLKMRKEKLRCQKALSFYKDVENIFGDAFCPIFVIEVLDQLWTLSAQVQNHDHERQDLP
jgi:hypothetical protein